MTSPSRFASFLLLATWPVAACGGTAAVEPTLTSAPQFRRLDAAPEPAEPAPAPPERLRPAPAGASDVTITGAIEGRVTGLGLSDRLSLRQKPRP